MFTTIEIQNFKSIDKAKLQLGRLNVLIGENGAGKSNILEAIALAGAASAGKLDNEFLASRGIRVAQPQYMRAAFQKKSPDLPIKISILDGDDSLPSTFELTNDNGPYSRWKCHSQTVSARMDFATLVEALKEFSASESGSAPEAKRALEKFGNAFISALGEGKNNKNNRRNKKSISVSVNTELDNENLFIDFLLKKAKEKTTASSILDNFIIFSPENTSLRRLEPEGQIEPLGVNGEGLLKFLSVLSEEKNSANLKKIKDGLKLFGWFDDFFVSKDQNGVVSRLEIRDRYLDETSNMFDQKSANEGFLFLMFYFSLFSSDLTPRFFAIDNIDASLNPKLCERLIRHLAQLAEGHGKQAILTTHNPAVLDGLNLDDDDQRLFVVSRGSRGQTRVTRILKPQQAVGESPIRLSEAFLRGSLGGLPKRF
ncbi:AAA family ATPase [Telmatospirillum siberiense]|uniref:Chromosome segregation protein SMC n=1 Tax=Telmatospirillum siberiense TaxID=382514 RepID=A0A2N3PS93_9PROT|nr:AAA family ATPase [Telmatospirillum siberiense]PKU23279.1 chromosome segregation protein SMC [Telmatospirillum siberiense]